MKMGARVVSRWILAGLVGLMVSACQNRWPTSEPTESTPGADRAQRAARLLDELITSAGLPQQDIEVRSDPEQLAAAATEQSIIVGPCVDELSDDELTAVLAHELAHVLSCDHRTVGADEEPVREAEADWQGLIWLIHANRPAEAAISRFDKEMACAERGGRMSDEGRAQIDARRRSLAARVEEARIESYTWRDQSIQLVAGNYAPARGYFEDYLLRHPRSYAAKINVSVTYLLEHIALDRGAPREGVEHALAKAVHVEPAAFVMGAADPLIRAEKILEEVVDQCPAHRSSALASLGVVADERGDIDRALGHYAAAQAQLVRRRTETPALTTCDPALFDRKSRAPYDVVADLYNNWGVSLFKKSQVSAGAEKDRLMAQSLDCFRNAWDGDGEDHPRGFPGALLNFAIVALQGHDTTAAASAVSQYRKHYSDQAILFGLASRYLHDLDIVPVSRPTDSYDVPVELGDLPASLDLELAPGQRAAVHRFAGGQVVLVYDAHRRTTMGYFTLDPSLVRDTAPDRAPPASGIPSTGAESSCRALPTFDEAVACHQGRGAKVVQRFMVGGYEVVQFRWFRLIKNLDDDGYHYQLDRPVRVPRGPDEVFRGD